MGLKALLQNEFTCEVFFCESIYSAPKCVGLVFEVCMCGNRNNGGKTKKTSSVMQISWIFKAQNHYHI